MMAESVITIAPPEPRKHLSRAHDQQTVTKTVSDTMRVVDCQHQYIHGERFDPGINRGGPFPFPGWTKHQFLSSSDEKAGLSLLLGSPTKLSRTTNCPETIRETKFADTGRSADPTTNEGRSSLNAGTVAGNASKTGLDGLSHACLILGTACHAG